MTAADPLTAGANPPITTPATTPSSHTDDPKDTRERLVRAAVEVFLEKGYGGTRVQDIARRAGFTSGALYVHFPSRTALLGEAIVSEGRSIVADMAERLAASAGGDDACDKLRGTAVDSRSNLDILLLEALALAARSADAKAALSASLSQFVGIIADLFDSAVQDGSLDPDVDRAALQQLAVGWIFGGIVVRGLGLDTADVDALNDVNSRVFAAFRPPTS